MFVQIAEVKAIRGVEHAPDVVKSLCKVKRSYYSRLLFLENIYLETNHDSNKTDGFIN